MEEWQLKEFIAWAKKHFKELNEASGKIGEVISDLPKLAYFYSVTMGMTGDLALSIPEPEDFLHDLEKAKYYAAKVAIVLKTLEYLAEKELAKLEDKEV